MVDGDCVGEHVVQRFSCLWSVVCFCDESLSDIESFEMQCMHMGIDMKSIPTFRSYDKHII